MESNEHLEQVAVCQWARLMSAGYPELHLLFAIPNGGKLPYVKSKSAKQGYFSPQRLKLVQEGMKPGVPDLCLPVARKGYHALYVEMKYGHNKTSDEQNEVISMLREQGNKVEVCYGADAAIRVIEEYLNIRESSQD